MPDHPTRTFAQPPHPGTADTFLLRWRMRLFSTSRTLLVPVLLAAMLAGCSRKTGAEDPSAVASLPDSELARKIVGTWSRPPGRRLTNEVYEPNGVVEWRGSNVVVQGSWRVSKGKLYYTTTNVTVPGAWTNARLPGLVDGTEFEHRLVSVTESELVFSIGTNLYKLEKSETHEPR